MKFEDALAELRKGKQITSSEITLKLYDSGELYVNSNIINSHHVMHLIVHDKWEVLEEPGKTFPEVFESFKNGKIIKRKIWENDWFIHADDKVKGVVDLDVDDLLANDWMVCDD